MYSRPFQVQDMEEGSSEDESEEEEEAAVVEQEVEDPKHTAAR